MSDPVSVDRKELQALLADNKELVERFQELLGKMSSLRKANEELQEKLRLAEQKLSALEARVGAETQQADEGLRKARSAMAKLMEEAERRLSQ